MKPMVPRAPGACQYCAGPCPYGPVVRRQLVTLLAGAGGSRAPATGGRRRRSRAVERHELDEAHVHRALAREVDEGVELVLDAVEQQRVHLDRREAGGEGGVEAGQRVVELAAAA